MELYLHLARHLGSKMEPMVAGLKLGTEAGAFVVLGTQYLNLLRLAYYLVQFEAHYRIQSEVTFTNWGCGVAGSGLEARARVLKV